MKEHNFLPGKIDKCQICGSNNLINVIQLINNIPDVFNLRNTMIVNDYLYKYTHLGIIKYKINSKYKIDENSNILMG